MLLSGRRDARRKRRRGKRKRAYAHLRSIIDAPRSCTTRPQTTTAFFAARRRRNFERVVGCWGKASSSSSSIFFVRCFRLSFSSRVRTFTHQSIHHRFWAFFFLSQRWWCLLLLRENRCLTTSRRSFGRLANLCYWMERRWYLLEESLESLPPRVFVVSPSCFRPSPPRHNFV